MFGDKTEKLRALAVGEGLTWPYSMRNTVYKLAENIGIVIQVRKRGEMMEITRISVMDRPRIECCPTCGHRRRVSPRTAHAAPPPAAPGIEDI